MSHVDDFVHGSSGRQFDEWVTKPLREKFLIGGEELGEVGYVGTKVEYSDEVITVNLDHYIEGIEIPDMAEILYEILREDLVDADI